MNDALNPSRGNRASTLVFGIIPICLVLIDGLLGIRSWDVGNAVAILPPIICGAAAWQGARATGRVGRQAWSWAALAVFAYYAWWVVIGSIVVAYSLS